MGGGLALSGFLPTDMGLTEVLVAEKKCRTGHLFWARAWEARIRRRPFTPVPHGTNATRPLPPTWVVHPCTSHSRPTRAPEQHPRQLKDGQTESQLRALAPAFDIPCAPCETRARAGASRTLPPRGDRRSTGDGPSRRPRAGRRLSRAKPRPPTPSSRPRSAAPGRDGRTVSDLPGAQPVRRPVHIGLAGDQIAGEVDEGAVGRVDADAADEHVGHGGGAGEAGVGRR